MFPVFATPKQTKKPPGVKTRKRKRATSKPTTVVHDKLVDVPGAVTTVVALIDDENVKTAIGTLLQKGFVERSKTCLAKLSAQKSESRKHHDFVSYIHIIVVMTLPCNSTGKVPHDKYIHNVLKEVLAFAGCTTKQVCARKSLGRLFCEKLTKFVDTNIIFSSKQTNKILTPLYYNKYVIAKGSEKNQYAQLMSVLTPVHRSWIEHKTAHGTMNNMKEWKKKLVNTFIIDHKIGKQKWIESFPELQQSRFKQLLENLQTNAILNSPANVLVGDKRYFEPVTIENSHVDMMSRCIDDLELARALLELKIGTPGPHHNQYQTIHNGIFSHIKEFDSGCCLAAVTFDKEDGGRPIWLYIIFIPSIREFDKVVLGEKKTIDDNYNILYTVDKSYVDDDDEKKDDIAGGIDVKFGKTTQAVLAKLPHALVWTRSKSDGYGADVGKKAMSVLLGKYNTTHVVNATLRIARSEYATGSATSTRGNLGEDVVNTLIDNHMTHKRIQSTMFAGSPDDTKLDNGKKIQVKTVKDANGKSSQQTFPISHRCNGEQHVPYTFEHCHDVVCAVRHAFDIHGKQLGFDKGWNAPEGTVSIVMVFTRDELVQLGKLGNFALFCFRAGEHLANCIYIMEDGELFDDDNVNLAKFD
jgi:hypothetical protein